jgi:hypothetical protein
MLTSTHFWLLQDDNGYGNTSQVTTKSQDSKMKVIGKENKILSETKFL